jgi:hypothetical protein
MTATNDAHDTNQVPAGSVPALAYEAPSITGLGDVRDLTFGELGSEFDGLGLDGALPLIGSL